MWQGLSHCYSWFRRSVWRSAMTSLRKCWSLLWQQCSLYPVSEGQWHHFNGYWLLRMLVASKNNEILTIRGRNGQHIQIVASFLHNLKLRSLGQPDNINWYSADNNCMRCKTRLTAQVSVVWNFYIGRKLTHFGTTLHLSIISSFHKCGHPYRWGWNPVLIRLSHFWWLQNVIISLQVLRGICLEYNWLIFTNLCVAGLNFDNGIAWWWEVHNFAGIVL